MTSTEPAPSNREKASDTLTATGTLTRGGTPIAGPLIVTRALLTGGQAETAELRDGGPTGPLVETLRLGAGGRDVSEPTRGLRFETDCHVTLSAGTTNFSARYVGGDLP